MSTGNGDAQTGRSGRAPGDARPGGGDGAAAGGTSGAPGVTNGVTSGVPPWAIGLGALITIAICTVNVMSLHHDSPHASLWWLFTSEYSSAAATILLLPAVARVLALARSPATAGWPRFLATHLVAVVGYSLLHVGGFVLIREAVFALAGRSYVFGGFGDWVYEFRKDALSYALIAGVFASARRSAARNAAPPPHAETPAASFDIRDGARVIRTPVADILAAASAGNYVEFRLADGRAPLMRTTLAAVEGELAPHGFVRTHRSWLVNRAAVREISPTGTGDARLLLGRDLEAPLSRRYPQAAEALRRGG